VAFGRSRGLSGSSSTLVFGIVPVEFGAFFVDDMRVAALVGWPRERILDVDLANRRGVASAGAVDQFLQIWRFAVVGQVSPPLAQNGSTAASTRARAPASSACGSARSGTASRLNVLRGATPRRCRVDLDRCGHSHRSRFGRESACPRVSDLSGRCQFRRDVRIANTQGR
jgi:hypothetical protein